MSLKTRCQFIHGEDSYRANRLRKAIEDRFLSKPDSFVDFIAYDMEETSLDTLKQSLLATPFFVQRRLFILKNVFGAPKATQDGLRELLPQVGESTYVVIFESKPCDKRLALYTWLKANVKVETCDLPVGVQLTGWIDGLAVKEGATLEPAARELLLTTFGADTWRIAHEVKKLAWHALAQTRTAITRGDVLALCAIESEESIFKLTDALRAGNLREAIRLYRRFMRDQEPIAIGGAIASQIRTLAKVWLGLESGTSQPEAIAKKSGVHAYSVKLSLGPARTLSKARLQRSYRALVAFDRSAKDGTVPPQLGLLLLIIRLHGTLKAR